VHRRIRDEVLHLVCDEAAFANDPRYRELGRFPRSQAIHRLARIAEAERERENR
jgi:hypothetical protein